jgi:hypothetical protein
MIHVTEASYLELIASPIPGYSIYYTGWSNTYHFCDYTFNN